LKRLSSAAFVALVLAAFAAPAHSGPGDANADSVYLVGELVDPVCIYQHGMQGTLQRQCAMVSGRVEQGMFFLDIRQRRLYTVIGQNHWEDPKQGFLDALGDTFAIRAHVWKRFGGAAIAINALYPWREQPAAAYAWWPIRWEWTTLAGCGLIALFYLLALGPWRARLGAPPGYETGRAIVFLSGLAVVIGSLNGPLHDLSDHYLFSTHMVQHLLLAQVFPLLLIVGMPVWLRRAVLRPRWVALPWRWLARAPIGFALYSLVLCLWHVPELYNLMMRNHDFHIVMHLMVMASATLMWWPIVGGGAVERPISHGARMLYLFLLGTPMMLVAALVTFAGQPLYEWYAFAPRLWGTTAVGDQRLGGLIMWVPGTMFYWGVMTVVYFQWAKQESHSDDPIAIPSAPLPAPRAR